MDPSAVPTPTMPAAELHDAGGKGSAPCPICAGRVRRRAAYRRGRWRVHLCESCGHGVTRPLPTDAELRDVYESAAYFDVRGMRRNEVAPQNRIQAEDFRRRFGGETLLDVGAGLGARLAAASQVGYRVTGTELSEAACSAIREHFGLDVRPGGFLRSQFAPDERFDVVTMIHVLEHMREPVEALRLARDLLGAGGHIVVAVPNRRGFMARFPGRTRRDVFDLPLHLHHFTLESLTLAIRAAGLEPESTFVSIPKGIDRVLGWARHATRTGAEARGRPTPLAAGSAGAPEARPSTGSRVVAWTRRHVPGSKITAVARARA